MPLGLVLDIETAPNRSLLAHHGLPVSASQSNTKLHRLSAFACFSFELSLDEQPGQFAMISNVVAPDRLSDVFDACVSEAEALGIIDRQLRQVAEDGLLVTFNGTRHDLPFLSRRYLVFGRQGGGALTSPRNHRDMMQLWRKLSLSSGGEQLRGWPSLARACEDAGIPHDLQDRDGSICSTVRKCETDVLATFLLFLLHAASGDSQALPFCSGWTSLARWCLKAPTYAHRKQFAFSDSARAAIRRTLHSTSP